MATTEPSTYWISVGRNVGAEPMSEYDWNQFRHEASRIASRHGRTITSVRNGVSSWDNADEDTFLLLVIVAPRRVASLRRSLARLARDYEQDAIGFVGGPGSSIITPEERF